MATTDINRLAKYLALVRQYPRRKRGFSIGDSWFQYPLRSFPDLQKWLATSSEFANKINFVDDSYPGRDADEVGGLINRWRRLAYTMREDYKPFDLFLLSLGGNDVIGLDFDKHLKRAGTPSSGVAVVWPYGPVPQLVADHIWLNELQATFAKIAVAYRLIIKMRDDYAPQATIITHTYADVTPNNTPYTFLAFKAGPWIWQPATAAGLTPAEQKALVRWLLAAFYELLLEIQRGTTRFVVLDTRGELPDTGKWDNEIHPRGSGFKYLAEQYWVPVIKQAIV